jgi:transposase
VVEVDRPDRQDRHRAGKSDPLDAVSAARAALSGRASALAAYEGVTRPMLASRLWDKDAVRACLGHL